ncbi:hypothetical protein [Xanthomonas campestris]|nr:hypothetical protein [Xanthomonas campestris]MCC5085940.1 hypothetical protein [Xanthomonas campestris]MEA9792341.1 hypothetical protein [Xanthomonas campestris pv. raphani]MEB1794314.1 hypothetical protein [Xanthomonas campestris pv. campestris]
MALRPALGLATTAKRPPVGVGSAQIAWAEAVAILHCTPTDDRLRRPAGL